MYTRTLLPVLLVLCAGMRTATAQSQEDYDGHGHRTCGTLAWIAAHHNEKGADRGILSSLCDQRVLKQRNHLTSGGHFRINYDVAGDDSVSVKDVNRNDVPDYIDSVAFYLEYTWDVEINQLGYLAPPPDNRGIGPELDIYICNLPATYYGLARPEEDNPTGDNTVSGFLILDNDYTGYPTPGIAGLRVTVAHEFHHIVQFSRYMYDFSQSDLYEATSVWMERQVMPTIPDYLQYVKEFLGQTQSYGFSTQKTREDVTGYAHVIYLDLLAKRINRDVVREIWDRFAETGDMFVAIDRALRAHSEPAVPLNLESSFCELAEWCYYTGARSRDTTYFLEARQYPSMRPADFRAFDGTDMLVSGSLYPLGFGMYRVQLPPNRQGKRDTVDFVITNARTNIGHGGPGIGMDNFSLELSGTRHDGDSPLVNGTDTVYYKFSAQTSNWCVNPIRGGAKQYTMVSVVSPQPYISDGASRMLFGVNLAKEQVQGVKVWIYSSSLARVRELEIRELDAMNNLLGVLWDGRDFAGNLVPSGVYLYEISVNDGTPIMGKLAVVRK